jgi:hypothetical protein
MATAYITLHYAVVYIALRLHSLLFAYIALWVYLHYIQYNTIILHEIVDWFTLRHIIRH